MTSYAGICARFKGIVPPCLDANVGITRMRLRSAVRPVRNQGGGGGTADMETVAGKKMVAVIGAGPSGLVAAKSLLEAGLAPTLFDKAPEVGGMWNPISNSCWASLRTNLSRYSCCFSDFPWDGAAPTFPAQRQVHEYLADYANKFLRPEHLALGSEVTSVAMRGEGKWLVEWTSESLEDKSSREFDFVVFASGFFAVPHMPVSIPGLDAFPGDVMHSSEYHAPERFRDKRVLIVGASLSSAEVAAEVATFAKEVVNVVSRPFWVLPRYVALDSESAATPFLPLDMVFYRRSRRPAHGKEEVFRGEEANRKVNQYFRKLCGDQGALNVQCDADPPFLAISDTYLESVLSKRIAVRQGKVGEVRGRAVILEDGTAISDVDCIIFCTGFQSSLPYLSPELLKTLSFDPSDRFLPFLLHRSTFHPSLPASAFVGMYRGPYFGIMELQARWAAAIFSGALPPIPDSVQREGVALEKQIRDQTLRPQFMHGDYVGFADAIAAELHALPSQEWCQKHDVVIPAHFRTGSVAEKAVEVLEKAWEEFSEGKMVPEAVFRSLAGSWTLRREIENRMDSAQSGMVEGTASFSPTAGSSHEYLYSELGELAMEGGLRFRVHRKYVYVYDAHQDQIDVFFEDQGSRGSPFHTLHFLSPGRAAATESSAVEQGASETSGGWRAEGKHLCGQDMYHASYRFCFQGNRLAKMEISYSVEGPKKDYTSTATYLR